MKFLLRLLVGLFVLVLLLLGVGFLLPADFKVQRTATINAPAATVYALISAPKAWKDWSVWNERDPNMKVSYSGPEAGAGAKWSWESPTEGNGNMEFVSAKPDQEIGYKLSFPDFGMTSDGLLTLTPTGEGVSISWSNQGNLGMNPLNRWFGLFMDKMVGPDFEAGLAKLKKLAESQPKPRVEPVVPEESADDESGTGETEEHEGDAPASSVAPAGG